MSAAASDLDKRGGDIESYLENFCRCSILHNSIGINSVPHQQSESKFRVRFHRVDQKVKDKIAKKEQFLKVAEDEESWRLETRRLGGRGRIYGGDMTV